MKKRIGTMSAAVLVLAALTARAEKEACRPAEGSVEIGVFSAYASRGQINNDEGVLQPSVTVAGDRFSFNFWGNFNLTDRVTEDPDFSEIDLTVSYTVPLETVELEIGVAEYVFPHSTVEAEEETAEGPLVHTRAAPGTRELFASAALPNDIVTPRVCAFYDFDEADGAYVAGSLEKDFSLGERLTLTPGVSAAFATRNYNECFFGLSEDTWNDGNVYATAEYAVNDALAVSVYLCYMWLLDAEIEDGARERYVDTEQFFGGATVGYTF